MKIGFVVNDIATEQDYYTTTRLALAATQRGHEAWLMGIGNFIYEADGSLSARARQGTPGKRYRSRTSYLADVQRPEVEELVSISDFDVVMLRYDPADNAVDAPWAQTAGVAFGQLIAQSGVLVVNDPTSLTSALSKAYFQHFPERVRPRTLISRDEQRIHEFVEDLGGKAVMKPLQGSGGSGVFLVDRKGAANQSQIVEAIARDGYVVVQEFLPEAKKGDVRMFVMNGQPLQQDGQVAAFRRRNSGTDLRSNMSTGAQAEAVTITDDMLELVEAVHPKLVSDGMFLVGLDIVGDKLMEINVFSPGGLGSCEELYDIDFAPTIIASLEHKIGIRRHYPQLENERLATL